MRIEYLLFPVYLLLCFWLIPRISFIRNSYLSALETRLLLAFKIVTGLVCAFYFTRLSSSVDYLEYNAEGKLQFDLLLSNPKLFFTDFTSDINTYGLGGMFEVRESFWAYIRFNLLYKVIAILNLVSRGNFYLNSMMFCSIVFFGHTAFYRVYISMYPAHKLKILLVCFCLPSVLLYTSAVHKDGIIFLSLGLLSFIFYRILSVPRSLRIKQVLFFFAGMASIFLFRNYVIVAIVPAMIIALLCIMLRYRKRFIIVGSMIIFSSLFFLSGLSSSFLNLPAAVVQRKADFASLGEANTNIQMNELQPSLQSFIINLPQAVNHYLFRPYLSEFPSLSILLTAIELFIYQLIIVAFILFRKMPLGTVYTFNIFGLIFLFNMMLIIGYTIPNIGGIVRYRSIFWIFLICPMLCNTDWKRIFRMQAPGPL